MDNPVILPLTEEAIKEFYGRNYGQHCRGWAIHYRGKLAAIVGVTTMPTLMLAWSDVKPDVKASHRVAYETSKLIMIKIAELGYPVIYAVANHEQKNAVAFLKKLGWKFMEDSPRGRIFRWRR